MTLDAFQKGLVDLPPRLRRFARAQRQRGRRGRPSWMFTIMRNAWIDETRLPAALVLLEEAAEASDIPRLDSGGAA